MLKSIREIFKKNKRKNTILVLTVFILCLLMVGFGISKIFKNNNVNVIKNADKKEAVQGSGSLSGWSLFFDMYTNNEGESVVDRTNSIDTLDYEFPTTDGTKLVTHQVSYTYIGSQSYPAHSLQIVVPVFKTGTDSDSELYTVQRVVNSGEWSYTEQTIEGKPYLVFTNNNDIAVAEAGEHLQGSFQIAYLVEGKDVYVRYNESTNSEEPLNKTFDAKFINTSDNETINSDNKTVKLNIGKSDYNLTKTASKLSSLDGIPSGDYTWVKYTVTARRPDGLRTTILDPAGNLIREDLPSSNCKILDKDLNEVSISDDNHYWIDGYTSYDTNEQATIKWELYIGYPVDEFDGEEITNTAYFYGQYTDAQSAYDKDSQTHKVEYIKDASVTINENDFKFEYSGRLYGIQKNQDSKWQNWTSKFLSTDKIADTYDSVTYYLSPVARYTGTALTVRVGDDRQYLVDTNGVDNNNDITGNLIGQIKQWMDEDDYFFTRVTIPVFKNGNGQNIGTYQAKLFVRYANTDTFVEYESFDTSASKTFTFTQDQKVVSWYFEIYDMTESIENTLSSYMTNNQHVLTTVAYAKSDIYDLFNNTYPDTEGINYNGRIHNFCYINVFDSEGNLLNEVSKSSYAGTGYNDGLADWDWLTYGHYMQRSEHHADFVAGREGYRITKRFSGSSQYDNNKWTGSFEISARPLESMGYTIGKMTKIDMYDLLPLGMEYDSSKNVEIQNWPYSYCLSGDFTNWNQFLKDHTTVDIKYNYNNTNRTKIHVSIDLTGYNVVNTCSYLYVTATIPVYVPYDSLAEYGLNYTNWSFINTEPGGGKLIWPYSRIYSLGWSDRSTFMYDTGVKGASTNSIALNDPDMADINENNSTSDDIVGVSYDTIKLLSAYSSESTLKKYVRSYTINDDDSITYNSEWKEGISLKTNDHYEYKLRIRNSMDNTITNVVLYDNLESYYYDRQNNQFVSSGDGWQGIFEGVDTQALEEAGYQTKVYYSTNNKAGSLYTNNNRNTISSDWALLSSLNESDYSQVKSIAIEILNQNGQPATIPIDTTVYAVVQMKAPSSNTKENAFNAYWTEWSAVDNTGQVIGGLDGIHSNITEVTIEGLNMKFLKTDETGSALAGATLQILDSNNVVVEEWTSTGEAHVVSGKLIAGNTYKLHEVSAPDGYIPGEDVSFTATNMSSSDTPVTIENAKTKVTIKKVDEDGNNLAGATLQILDDEDNVIEEWTSNSTAHVISGVLEFGKQYTLHEESAPDGYVVGQDQTFTISRTDNNKTVTMVNKKTSVKISKTDIASGNELSGATLQVLNSSGSVVEEWISNGEPHEIEGLVPEKEYTIKETVAPEGYTIADEITFTIDEQGNVTSTGTVTDGIIIVENEKTNVKINKVAIADGEELAGAHLQILDSDENVVEEWDSTGEDHEVEGLKTGEEYTIKETVAPDGYTIASNTKFTIDETGNVTYTGTTASNGVLLVENAKTIVKINKVDVADGRALQGAVLKVVDSEGTVVDEWTSNGEVHEIEGLTTRIEYTIKETTPPDGYMVVPDIKFTIDNTGRITTTATVNDEGVVLVEDSKTSVDIIKVDEDGNAIQGAVLQVLKDDDTIIDNWTSDGRTHTVVGKLVAGNTYKLHEVSAPEGYARAADVTFKVNSSSTTQTVTMTDKKTKVNILKTDANGNGLAGAVLRIKDGNTVVHEWTSTTSTHNVTGILTAGKTYTLEEVTPPNGYAKAVSKTFTVPTDGSNMRVTMSDTKTKLEVRKVDNNNQNISGVVLQILDANNNSVVQEWTTTSSAKVVEGLTAGHAYILHEASAPDGYLIASDIRFTMNTDIGTQQIVMTDGATKVTINKVDSQGNKLEGAKLQILSGSTVIDEWTTTAGSSHEITGLLGEGKTYTLHEVKPPTGYVTASDKTFTVNSNTTNLNVEMVDEQNVVSLVKISGETNTPLAGSLLQVIDKNNNVVYEFRSTEEKVVLTGILITGETYRLHEAGAPNGYARTEDITFTVGDSTTELAVEIKDPLTNIYISKVDNKNKSLSGAKLQIIDENNNVIKEFTSTEEKEEIKGLLNELEVYTLHEESAPEGYDRFDDIKFKIDETGHLSVFDGEKYTQIEDNILVAVDKKQIIVNPQTTFVSLIVTFIIGTVISMVTILRKKQKKLNA